MRTAWLIAQGLRRPHGGPLAALRPPTHRPAGWRERALLFFPPRLRLADFAPREPSPGLSFPAISPKGMASRWSWLSATQAPDGGGKSIPSSI